MPKPAKYFFMFMGWLILYSFLFFLFHNIIQEPPSGPNPDPVLKMIYFVLPIITIPLWWFSWRWFNEKWGEKEPFLEGDKKIYSFANRMRELNYYFMVLKPFLLALGANGLIVLDHYKGGMRTFYIINFIVIYLYALPFLIIKIRKYADALKMKCVLGNKSISIKKGDKVVSEISLNSIDTLILDTDEKSMFIQGNNQGIYLGGEKSKGSGFYISSYKEILETVKRKVKNTRQVEKIKDAMKEAAFKPAI